MNRSETISSNKRLTTEESTLLKELRKKQTDGNWTDDDRKLLLRLQSQEKDVSDIKSLSPEERVEYTELTRRQTNGENWTDDDARRVSELQYRVDRSK